MPVLTTAVVVVGLLCLLDLVLTFGVIRRLREHTALLSDRAPASGGPDGGPAIGSTVADFAAGTVDGAAVDRDWFTGQTVVGFFSPGCAPCDELRPSFIGHAATVPGGRDRVLAVLNTFPDADDTAAAVAELSRVARVVVEPAGGDGVASAFGVRGYPTLCVVDAAGRVTASGTTLDALRQAPVAV